MFDQATAVSRLDLQDPAKVALVPLVIDSALAIAETYCDRSFMEQDTVETVVPVYGNTIKVRRFPIESVNTISSIHGGTVADYHVDKRAGVVYLDGRGFWHEATISYKGGFSILPPDLEIALWLIFDAVWSATPGAGKAFGATTSSGTGAIKSVSTPDAGSITYFDPTTSAASSAGAFLPADAVALLDPYRRLDA